MNPVAQPDGYVLDLTALTQPVATANCVPAHVQVFSDAGSWFHVGLGVLSGYLSDPWNLALFAAFTGYEVSKAANDENWVRTGGKFIEYAIGLALAAAFRVAVGRT